jgi:hypothetical protein
MKLRKTLWKAEMQEKGIECESAITAPFLSSLPAFLRATPRRS